MQAAILVMIRSVDYSCCDSFSAKVANMKYTVRKLALDRQTH